MRRYRSGKVSKPAAPPSNGSPFVMPKGGLGNLRGVSPLGAPKKRVNRFPNRTKQYRQMFGLD